MDCDSLSDWLDSESDSDEDECDPDESESEELVFDGLLKLAELSLRESLDSDALLLSDDPLESLEEPLPEDDAELELEPTDETESETDDSDDSDESELSLDDTLDEDDEELLDDELLELELLPSQHRQPIVR